MITRFTKIQLLIFAIITVLGTAYVGGRYAEVDRLVVDRTFPVTADFADSGGIFAGAQVTYRGIEVGQVERLEFTDDGVDVVLDIEKSAPQISADTEVIVANKSAIGEQFVDLQPRSDQGPYLEAGSEIPRTDTQIPLDTTTLLLNLDALVSSVDTQNLKTLVAELGAAFEGTGPDLERILDTSTEFVTEAQANIGVTRDLIRNSSGVLQTQIDKQGQLATFSENLALLSDTLVEADPDIRQLLDEGTPAARDVRQVVDENATDLRTLFSNLRVATEPLARNSKSLQVLSILYPYLLEGSFSVTAPSKRSPGEYDASFGLVVEEQTEVCKDGYRTSSGGDNGRRAPSDLSDLEASPDINCTDDNLVPRNPDKTEINRNRAGVGSNDGEDDWQWLLLGPATS